MIARCGAATPDCCFQLLKFYSVVNSCWLKMSQQVKCFWPLLFYCCQSLDPGQMLKRREAKRGCSDVSLPGGRTHHISRTHTLTGWVEFGDKKKKTVGCVETHRERWTQRNNKHGQKTEDASAAAQFCCSSELWWVCFSSFWEWI